MEYINKLLIFILLNQIIFGNALKCGVGIKKHKKPGIIKENSNKRLLGGETSFEPIKIKVDYTQLKIDTKN